IEKRALSVGHAVGELKLVRRLVSRALDRCRGVLRSSEIISEAVLTKQKLNVSTLNCPRIDGNEFLRQEAFPFFAHRARAAFRALSRRCSGVSAAARARPPFVPPAFPPSRPSATAAGFLRFAMTTNLPSWRAIARA